MKTNDILLPESEWILLSEEQFKIKQLEWSAKDSLATLQELEKLAGVTSREKYEEIKNDLTVWIRLQMLNDKKVRELSAIVPIEQMIVPDHLQKVRQLFTKDISFDCLMYSNGWQVNKTALHEASNRLRSFAKSQKQIDRYHASKSLADFLNTNVKIGMWNKGKFANEMVGYFSNSGKWEIYEQFILADGDAYVN